jgi:glycosyltransferase involved in cell wall biosynthesis
VEFTQKEALDFVWKRKKFPMKSFLILVDDVFHQPFLGVLSFWAWFSGCNSIKLLDRNQKEMELPIFRKTFFPLLMDLLKWPFVLRYHQKIVGHLEKSTPFYFPIHSPKNILYLRTDQWFQLKSGGSVGHTSGVINALFQLGKKLEIWSSDSLTGVNHPIQILESNFNQGGNIPEFMDIQFNHSVFHQANQSAYQPDCIYQRYSLLNYSGVALKEKWNVPLIVEYNGSFVWIGKNWGGAKMIHKKLIERVENLVLKKADLIVVVSEVSKNDLVQVHGIDASKILVNPNGVDPERYHPAISGDRIRNQFNLNKKRVLGFIGTFSKWHGVTFLADCILEFFKKYPEKSTEVVFLLIGKGPEFSAVKNKLHDLIDTGQIVLPGQIPQEESPEYLAACDVLLSPHVPNPDGTKFFGSPTKLFEYMAIGKPILASSLEQIGEILEDGKTARLHEPANLEQCVNGLLELAENDEKWTKMGSVAREVCLEKYTWQCHVERIFNPNH